MFFFSKFCTLYFCHFIKLLRLCCNKYFFSNLDYVLVYVTHLFVPITKFVSLKKARYDLTRFCSASLNYFFSWKKSNIPIKLECLTKTDILLNSLTKVDLSSQLNTVK